MNTLFGNVYLAADKENTRPILLENIYFCNLRQKLVDSAGNESPLHKVHSGKRYFLQFKISQQDKNGIQVECDGKFTCQYNLGQVPPQDFENSEIAHQEIIEWLTSYGVLSEDEQRVHEAIQGSPCVAAICPGLKLCDMRMLRQWNDSSFILDYYLDLSSTQKSVPFKSMQAFWTYHNELLKGKKVFEENYLRETLQLPKSYLNYAAVNQDFHAEATKLGHSTKELLLVFKEFHAALALENCREWSEKQEDTNSFMYRATQSELRYISIGAKMAVELIYFDRGLQLHEQLRDSFLYKTLIRTMCQHVSLVNDVLSLKKEMECGTVSNAVYLYHVKDGLSLKDAFEKAVNIINQLREIAHETGELLVQLFPDYVETTEVVAIIQGFAFGNIQWSAISSRYHKDLVYDCVIENV